MVSQAKVALITGGAGFIGSYLCERLIVEGFNVICMDNLITGNLDNIDHLMKNSKFAFIRHDVSKTINLTRRVDYVLHFASPASPIDYLNYPIQTLKVGSLGAHNALGVAKAHNAKFMLASTSEVYGDPLVHPQKENYWGHVNPVGVRGCYDESKRFAEAITMAYHRVHKVDTRIIRIFNTYGPRMRIRDGRVVPNFISQALTGEQITVYGKGMQTRSFCFISDLIEGIYRVMKSSIHDPINLGNPSEFTIMQLAKLVAKLTETKSKIVFKPLPQDDPKQRQPDISKAKRMFKWQPKVKLEKGLDVTINWFRDKVD